MVKGEKKVRCDSLLLCRPLSGVQQATTAVLLQNDAARFNVPSWLRQALETVPSFKYTRSGLPARDVGRGAEADRRISQPDARGAVREGAALGLGL